jgi:hypothetical protein
MERVQAARDNHLAIFSGKGLPYVAFSIYTLSSEPVTALACPSLTIIYELGVRKKEKQTAMLQDIECHSQRDARRDKRKGDAMIIELRKDRFE